VVTDPAVRLPTASDQLRRLRQRVREWAEALLDPGDPLWDVGDADPRVEVLGPDPDQVVARLREGGGWRLPEPSRPGELLTEPSDPDRLREALRTLDRRARRAGCAQPVLHLAAGLLRWTGPEGRARSLLTPLLLVPVGLEAEGHRLVGAGSPLVNPLLTTWLAGIFGIELPEAGWVPSAFWEEVASRLSRETRWRLEPWLGLLAAPVGPAAIYRDLVENEDRVIASRLVQALVLGADSGLDFRFTPLDDARLEAEGVAERTACVLDADADQLRCVRAAGEGRSFVIDGPPGTGKSQTLANIAAELLASGRTVLVVSERAAALESVRQRLAGVGLGQHLLWLAETGAELAAELRAQLHAPPDKATTTDLGLTDLGRDLTDYADAVCEPRSPLGMSLHQVLARLLELESAPALPWPEREGELDAGTLDRILDHARALGRAWGAIEHHDLSRWGLGSDDQGMAMVEALRQELKAAEEALAELWETVREEARTTGLDWSQGLAEAEHLHQVLLQLPGHPPIPLAWLVERPWERLREEARAGRALLQAVERAAASLEARGLAAWRRLLGRDRLALQQAESALVALPVPWPLHPQVTVHDLAPVAAFLATASAELAALQPDLERAVVAFGLDPEQVTLERFEEVAELARLMASPARPEAHWLDPARIEQLEQAVQELETLLQDYEGWHQQLTDVFADEVLGLDLPAMWSRIQAARGLARLSGAYHEDLRMLAACSRQGKATRDVIERLPDAIAWQRAGRALDDFGYRWGELLGAHYFWRERTDVAALREAIGVARRAVAVARERSGAPELRALLALDGTPDPALAAWVEELAERAADWRRRAAEALGMWAQDLARVSVQDLAESCAWAQQPISTVHAVLDRAGQVAGRTLTLEETREALAGRVRVEEAEAAFLEGAGNRSRLFGPLYRDELTDWDGLEAAIDWAQHLSEQTGPLTEAVAGQLLQAPGGDRLGPMLERWRRARLALAARLPASRRGAVEVELEGAFAAAADQLGQLRQALPDAREWTDFARHRRALEAEGLGPAIELCVQRRLPRDHIAPALERAVLERWADDVVAHDPRLARFRAAEREEAVRSFQARDRELLARAPTRVRAGIARRWPGPNVTLEDGRSATELLTRFGKLVQRLRPCVLATPGTVARLLPPDLRFDAVLFDEASRIRPGEAASCLYRADQVVIAGDPRQAPPADSSSSILDVCQASGTFTTLSLERHYRSRHVALIAYPARAFYGDRLTTFPGPLRQDRELGVHVYRVPGSFRTEQDDNPEEARAVARRLVELARTRPLASLGVVASTEAQAAAIEAEARRLFRELAGAPAEPLWITTPGEAQGEERDLILLSLTYAPDPEGRMPPGWLVRPGGERLLTVALTRARRRLEVFGTITVADLPDDATPGGGLWHLRQYLLSAERPEEPEGELDPFQRAVARKVEAWGYRALPAGNAGLGIARPGDRRFLLGVLSDGPAYQGLRVARDRDRLRQEVLEGRGWRLHRLWQPAWWYEREQEEQRLRRALEEAAAAPRPDPWSDAVPSPLLEAARGAPAPLPPPVAAKGPPPWAVLYRRSRPSAPQGGWDMGSPEAGPELRRMVAEVVELEGPVHQEVVLERVREAWPAGRLTEGRRYNFAVQLRRLQREGAIEHDEGFLRLPGQRPEAVRVPDPGDPATRRAPGQVPADELDLALKQLAAESPGADEETLVEAAARLFGWEGDGARAVLGLALARVDAAAARHPRPTRAEAVEVLDPIPSDIHRCLTPQGHDAFLRARAMLQERLTASGPLDAAIIQERLAAIDRVLAEARVLPPPASTERVALGTLVALARPGEPEEVYQVVGPLEAEAGAGKLNVLTPLGVAVWQRRAGESVMVQGAEPYEIIIAAIDRP
jgi:transcription elongation GreA/GreB family factor